MSYFLRLHYGISVLLFATVGLLDHHHHCYAMIVYGQVELCAFNRGQIPPARAVRKTLFDLHIWRPSYSRNYLPLCLPAATPVSHRLCTATSTELTVPAPIAPASIQANITNTPVKVKVKVNKRLTKQNGLKIATLNVRSLGGKFSAVSDLITDHQLDVLSISESWHQDVDDVPVLRSAPPGYRHIDVCRPRTSAKQPRGGGVIIYFRDHFVVKKIESIPQQTTFEFVCASLSTPSGPVIVVCIYRPGSSLPDSTFFYEFSSFLKTVATFNSQLVIAGDLNIHLEDDQDPHCIQFNRLLESCALKQHVNSPTHEKGVGSMSLSHVQIPTSLICMLNHRHYRITASSTVQYPRLALQVQYSSHDRFGGGVGWIVMHFGLQYDWVRFAMMTNSTKK